jgi:methionyl-tRNA formyltransferase
LKILFAGTPANAATTLKYLLGSPFEVVGVLTRPDALVGRKRILTPSAVAQVAQDAGIPTIKAVRVDADVQQQIASLGADVGVVVAYGALLSQQALDLMPMGWLNLHYSLLPDWRGAAPVQNALLNGDQQTGVTLFKLDVGLDTGPILGQVPTLISPSETFGELLGRLTLLGNTLLSEQLPLVASGLSKPVAQDPKAATRIAAKPTRKASLINWRQPAQVIENQIRAFNPEPIAYTTTDTGDLRILQARVTPDLHIGNGPTPGHLHFEKNRVFAACGGASWLELLQVQPAGKNQMLAADWARGAGSKLIKLGKEEDNG